MWSVYISKFYDIMSGSEVFIPGLKKAHLVSFLFLANTFCVCKKRLQWIQHMACSVNFLKNSHESENCLFLATNMNKLFDLSCWLTIYFLQIAIWRHKKKMFTSINVLKLRKLGVFL